MYMRDLFIIECLNTKLFQSIVNELRRCDYVCYSNFDESEHYQVTPALIAEVLSYRNFIMIDHDLVFYYQGEIVLNYSCLSREIEISYDFFHDFINDGRRFLLDYYAF